MKILVLMGGDSPERAVSLQSGLAVAKGLKEAQQDVVLLDTAQPNHPMNINEAKQWVESFGKVTDNIKKVPDLINLLPDSPILRQVDMVFIALHGGSGEDGKVQALLELMKIPYTGSNSTACALAMHKQIAKTLVEAVGVLTPEGLLITNEDSKTVLRKVSESFGFPVVVKPESQGSTIGISIVKNVIELDTALTLARSFDKQVLIERFIDGRELTVAILGDEVLPIVEILPEGGFYDYQRKYEYGQSRYQVPAQLSAEVTRRIQETAIKIFKIIGCAIYGRIDFRLTDIGKAYFLEVNTVPGMASTSLVPKAANAIGLEFPGLVLKIVQESIVHQLQR